MDILRNNEHREPGPKRRRRRRRRPLRSIAMLPSMATLGNLICGFAAIHFAAMYLTGREMTVEMGPTMSKILPSNLAIAGYLIFLAMFFDALDGQLARLTRHSSEFGAQLDSLADVVSFGVAPAFMVICLLTHSLDGEAVTPVSRGFIGRASWVMAAVYVACAGLRLARFNVESGDHDTGHKSFRGLPSPAAGFTICALIVLHEDVLRVLGLEGGAERTDLSWASAALVRSMPLATLVLGLLMVSRIRYIHLANAYLRGRRPFTHLVGAVFVLAVFLVRPQLTLSLLAVLFTTSGPFFHVVRRLRGGHASPPPAGTQPVPTAPRLAPNDDPTERSA